MGMRTMNHLLQYGEPWIRRTVPLCIALLAMTKPNNNVMDTLQKLAYDPDNEVAMSSILALGLIWAGSNNSRLAGNLRQLATYYSKDPDHLFCTRITQGLVHMGKVRFGES